MKKLSIYFSLCLLLGLSSCEKFLDVNDNPNSPTVAPLNGLLAGTTYSTGMNVYRASYLVNNYSQYLASSNPSSAYDIYEFLDANTLWTNLYDNMTDLQDMMMFAEELGGTDHIGVAKIMMGQHLSIINDFWGAAPYSAAFTLDNPTPEYDDGQTIFETAITLIDEGIASLQAGNSAVTLDNSLDLIHNGNTDAWIRTGYALKARMLNNLSKTAEYNPAAVLSALDNAYQSNADDAELNSFDVRSPWAGVALSNANLVLDGWLSEHFVDAMNGTTFGVFDPRLPLITNLTKFGDYRGTKNGAGRVGNGTSNEESVLPTNGIYSSDNSPLFLINYFEMKFIEAEVTLQSDPGRAYSAYLEGIEAHMDKLGVDAPDKADYLSDPVVAVGQGNLTLKRIMDEKYKAMFLHYATWTDARRLDYQYTDFQMPTNAALPNFIRRVDYPSNEQSRNGVNVPEIDGLDSRLWWDE